MVLDCTRGSRVGGIRTCLGSVLVRMEMLCALRWASESMRMWPRCDGGTEYDGVWVAEGWRCGCWGLRCRR
jgi:hypothetical protein